MTLRRFLALAGLAVTAAACRHDPGFDPAVFRWTNRVPAGARGLLTMFSLFRARNDTEAGIVAEIPPGVTVDASTMNGTRPARGAA